MTDLEQFDPEADYRLLWEAGKLSWLLHEDQIRVYEDYQRWRARLAEAARNQTTLPGMHPKVYALDCSRRWGKDYMSCVVAEEAARAKPNQIILLATSFAVDVNEIVLPLFQKIHETCPVDLRPVYKGSHQGQHPGLYHKNGSIVRLVGIDRNPAGLRGRGLDRVIISEAGFVDYLGTTLRTVLEPQLLGRPGAHILLNSTPPIIPLHEWDTEICPDAKDRGAYSLRTLDDNPLIPEYEKRQIIEAAGGKEDPTVLREFFCVRVRDEAGTVCPEFNPDLHVKELTPPDYAHCYTILDPGVSDFCAAIFCYYSYLDDRIVIQREFCKRNANTLEVAQFIKKTETELWGAMATKPLQYWGPKGAQMNPYMRVSDTDARMILDLNSQHGLRVSPSRKDDAAAALHSMRNLIKQGKVIIDPACKNTIAHLTAAVWNKSRTSYQRSELYGHYDLLDCVKYGVRAIARGQDPSPPEGQRIIAQAIARGEPVPALTIRAETQPMHKGKAVLERAFGGRRRALFGGRGRR